jgi:hypothetical protein
VKRGNEQLERFQKANKSWLIAGRPRRHPAAPLA